MSSVVWSSLSRLGREAARIVLPSDCIVCGGALPWRDRVGSCCRPCWTMLPRITGGVCRSCGISLPAVEEGEALCIACVDRPMPTLFLRSWGHYRGSLEQTLHAFKFQHHDFLDEPLAELLASMYVQLPSDEEFDVVIGVPMHRKKRRERGYNQADLLARHLARLTGLAYRRNLLDKVKNNETQSTLPKEARAANVRSVFEASPKVAGASVLLIDDVCTTGETLRACAQALLKKRARKVAALTVARA